MMQEGLFDRWDVALGRWSDSDGTGGKRRRSWGATVFFWLCLPMVFLLFCSGLSLVITSVAGRSTVPNKLMDAYDKCLKVASQKERCKMPTATSGRTKYFEMGWPPLAGAGLLVLIGFLYSVWRRKQDFDRFKQTADTLAVFVKQGKEPPADVLSAFKGIAEKMVGELPKLGDTKKTETPVTEQH